MRSALDWCFRSRVTGRITVAQWPNWSLAAFIVASGLEWALPADGTSHRLAHMVAVGSLIIWAGDEVIRGVNPWRRALGAAVLLYELVVLLR